MLWFDGDRGCSISEQVMRAADHYRKKYGRPPNLCLIHPSSAGEACPERVDGIAIRAHRSVLKHHLWLGWGEPEEAAA
jgi:hypothetical protein